MRTCGFFLAYTVWLLSPCAVSRIPLCCNRLHLRAQQEAPLEGPAPGGLNARQRISKHDWGDGAAGMEPAHLQLLLAPCELISEVSVGSRTTIIRLQRDVAGCCTSGEGLDERSQRAVVVAFLVKQQLPCCVVCSRWIH